MQDITLVLKFEAGKLTGTYTAPGRGGAEPVPVEIQNGKVEGDTVSFELAQAGRGGGGGGGAAPAPTITKFTGKLSADGKTIEGTRTPPGRGGAEPMPQPWKATKK
jgi:hypothetical protein